MEIKDTCILFYPATWPDETRGRIPYALLYLERMIRDFPVKIVLIDEQNIRDYDDILKENSQNLLFVGVSAMTGYQINGGIEFSKKVKSISNAKVIWGGWHATLLPNQVLEKEYIDFVIAGQGEDSFKKLANSIINKDKYEDIPGLAYRQEKQTLVNKPDKFNNINNFPEINYQLIDLNNYVFKPAYAERCIGYFSSHGCPYNCGFCCVAEVYGRKWYHKQINTIIQDLKYFKTIANIDSVTFDDDNFFVNKTFTIELCKAMIASGLNLKWDTSAHAGLFLRLFSDEELDLFYKAGCRQIYIGAESGDEEMLSLIDKKANVNDNFEFVKVLNKHKITPLFSTMVCFPVNPNKDLELTFEMIRKSKLIDKSLRVRVFFYTPYPGTELYKLSLKKGFVEPNKLEDWSNHTLRKFHAPWWERDYRKEIEVFANFYLPMCNPKYYSMVPKKFRILAFIINKVFYPITIIRFKTNCLKFPIEAKFFLLMLRGFNKLFKTNFSLGFESYLD